MSIESLKQRLAHIPGIQNLTMRLEGGKNVYSLGAGFAAVDPAATDPEIEAAILTVLPQPGANVTPLPAAPTIAPASPAAPVRAPAPGSFVAGIRAMMDDARGQVDRARADGMVEIGKAVDELHAVKVATVNVSSRMSQTIRDEAATMMSELGQISNDL